MWVLYAITASIFWGIDYTLTGAYRTDIPELLSSNRLSLLVVFIVIAFTIANTCIVAAIGNKNATLAGLLEISYPFFIVVFSWFFFKNANITIGTAIGGVCIIIGVAIILYLK